MKRKASAVTVICLILATLFLGFTDSAQLVKGQTTVAEYSAIVHITSPIQNETFHTNNVPLTFTFETNINASNTHSVVFGYILDGYYQNGYHDGHDTRIGEFYPPLSSSYSATMNVPDGNHLLWVQVNFYTNDPGIGFTPIINLTQIVNFTVDTSTSQSPSPNSSPSPTETPTPAMTASLSESASALNYGNTVNFTVSVNGGVPPYAYAWYMDGQSLENSSSPYFSTNSQTVGSHHVYVQVTDAENNSATTLAVEFNVLPGSSPSSSNPTQQPTPPIEINSDPNLPLQLMLGILVVLLVLVSVGLVFYFKKTPKKEIS